MNSEFDSNISRVNNIICIASDAAGLRKHKSKYKKKVCININIKKWFDNNCNALYRYLKTTARLLSHTPYNKELHTMHTEYFRKRKIYKKYLKEKREHFMLILFTI